LAFASTDYLTVAGGGASSQRGWIANTGYHVDGTNNAAGWNDMMDFYTKGFVVGGRASIKAAVVGGSMMHLTFSLSTTNAQPATVTEAVKAGRTSWAVQSTYAPAVTLPMEYDVSEVLTKPKVLDDPELYSTRTSAPLSQIYLTFNAMNPSGGALTVAFMFSLELTVVFTDPIPIVV